MCWTLAFLKRGREKKQYLLGVFVGVDQTTCEFFFISHTISNEYVSATISLQRKWQLTRTGSGVAVFLSGCVEESKPNLRVLHCPHIVTVGEMRRMR